MEVLLGRLGSVRAAVRSLRRVCRGKPTVKSSFYLFPLRNGKKRLAYGTTPDDAIEILRMRLTDNDMKEIPPLEPEVIRQTDIPRRVKELG